MTGTWLSVKEAAVRLEASERTVWRRIKEGRLESRETPEGRRQVCVEVPLAPADTIRDALTVVRDVAEQNEQAAGGMLTLARERAEFAEGIALTAKRSSRWAWGAVAAMVVISGIITGIIGWRLSSTTTTVEHLTDANATTESQLSDAIDANKAADDRLEAVTAQLVGVKADYDTLAGTAARTRDELSDARKDLADARAAAIEAAAIDAMTPPAPDGPGWMSWRTSRD